jgi:glucose/arabinose dehydrogenase
MSQKIFLGLMVSVAIAAALIASPDSNPPVSHANSTWPDLTLTLLATGLSAPVHLAAPDDGSGNLYVVEQAGLVKVLQGTTVLPSPLLDITDRVLCCGERGLLSIAFPPDYAHKNYFYLNYTRTPDGATVISRFYLTAPAALTAEPASEQVVLIIDQPYSNHNGGQIAFSPADGYLYIGTGDGGSGGDPQGNAQNPGSLLGKMMRIDVESVAAPLSAPPPTPVPNFVLYFPLALRAALDPYLIPPDNPFRDDPAWRPEIWASGLRNPWRFSFDTLNGDLYIADVGQNAWEEVDWQPSSSLGGENYGWNIMEGGHCYSDPNCSSAGLVLPVVEYDHSLGCAISGGYVYRGAGIPDLQAAYLYGDHCSGRIWGLRQVSGGWESTLLLDSSLEISSFGQDQKAEIYVVDHTGGI